MKKDFERMDTCILGTFDDGRLIGSIVGSSDGRKGWINRLAIDPDFRGRGLGLTLIKECENFLSDLGIKVFACLIEDWNAPSLSVFKKAGFDISDKILYCSKRGSMED
jgi:GNAT superfamily N-acetyltransferase